MDNNEKLRDRIKKSLQNAISTVDLKTSIEKEIFDIMSMIHELTDGKINFRINENNMPNSSIRDSAMLVFLQKTDVNYPYGFNIMGYTLNYQSGYPVIIETESEYYDCNNESELKDTIASIIDKKSLQIVQLISQKIEDIPF